MAQAHAVHNIDVGWPWIGGSQLGTLMTDTVRMWTRHVHVHVRVQMLFVPVMMGIGESGAVCEGRLCAVSSCLEALCTGTGSGADAGNRARKLPRTKHWFPWFRSTHSHSFLSSHHRLVQ